MAFINNPTSDPVLKVGERLGRIGSVTPPLGLAVVNIAGAIARAAGHPFPWGPVVVVILGFTAVGQVMVWIGMHHLRRSAGWDCGIVFYLWVGGLLTAYAILFTGVFPPLVVPGIAPVVATVAKVRLVRRKRAEGIAA